MISVFKKIEQLCNEKNISSEQLCIDVGISKSALSSYRIGRRNIPPLKLKKIAHYLGVPTAYLEDETDVMTLENYGAKIAHITQDKEFMSYILKLYSLPDIDKRYVFRYVMLLSSNPSNV